MYKWHIVWLRIKPTREFQAFKNIDNLSQKIIITNDDIDYSTSVVRHIKLKDFLLMESL